jgi:hypothetical protein
MHLARAVSDEKPDIPKLIRIDLMACTINGQVVTINTLRNLVGKLLREANQMMSNQLLLGFQIA